MDPAKALSQASSILSFAEFGHKLVTCSVKLPNSGEEATSTIKQLELINGELLKVTSRLSAALRAYDVQVIVDEDELAMRSVAVLCRELGAEFAKVIDRLVVMGPFARYETVKKAFQGVWKGKEIAKYQQRLDEVRARLGICLLAILSNTQSRLRCEIVVALHDLRRDVQNDLSNLVKAFPALLHANEDIRRDQAILDSLRFPSMIARYQRIPSAHAKTFEWVFSPSTQALGSGMPFKEWLESGDGIYWICGKAGSGKSTLVKFLHDHETTKRTLRKWAGEKQLVTAQCYFWNSGTDMQKSQEGLLQSLVYDIFRDCPTFIREICPQRWKDPHMHSNFWTRSELMQVLSDIKAGSHTAQGAKFCFFIDGLDEYEGDHLELIKVIRDFVSSPGIKVCASSRPWQEFLDAFGTVDTPSLKLEDLTRDDIFSYTKMEFKRLDTFAQLQRQDSRFDQLAHEVTKRAQGVFLWVYLVIRAMRASFDNADSFADCERRLESFPTDLDAFFKSTLEMVDPTYHEEAARILQLCLYAREPLLVLTLSYFDDIGLSLAMAKRSKYPTEEVLNEHCSIAELRIRARCGDLLETVEDNTIPMPRYVPKRRLEFLHRTVRDWLETTETQTFLLKRLNTPFVCHRYLSRSYLMQIKLLPFNSDEDVLRALIENLMIHALSAERHTGETDVITLDNLEKFGLSERTYMSKFYGQCLGFGELRLQKGWVAALAAQFGLHLYVTYRLDADLDLLHKTENQPLEYWVMQPRFPARKTLGPDPLVMQVLRDRISAMKSVT